MGCMGIGREEKEGPDDARLCQREINCTKLCKQPELYASVSVCQEFHQKISKDKAARRARQNQEWGTTKDQNPESNSINKQISKPRIN